MGVEGDWDETKTGKGMKNAPALGVRLCWEAGSWHPGSGGGGEKGERAGRGRRARFFLCQRVRRLVSTALVVPASWPPLSFPPPPPNTRRPQTQPHKKSVPRTVPSTQGAGAHRQASEKGAFFSTRWADTPAPATACISLSPLSPDPGAAPHPLGDSQPARLCHVAPHREGAAGGRLFDHRGGVFPPLSPHNNAFLRTKAPPPPPRAQFPPSSWPPPSPPPRPARSRWTACPATSRTAPRPPRRPRRARRLTASPTGAAGAPAWPSSTTRCAGCRRRWERVVWEGGGGGWLVRGGSEVSSRFLVRAAVAAPGPPRSRCHPPPPAPGRRACHCLAARGCAVAVARRGQPRLARRPPAPKKNFSPPPPGPPPLFRRFGCPSRPTWRTSWWRPRLKG